MLARGGHQGVQLYLETLVSYFLEPNNTEDNIFAVYDYPLHETDDDLLYRAGAERTPTEPFRWIHNHLYYTRQRMVIFYSSTSLLLKYFVHIALV